MKNNRAKELLNKYEAGTCTPEEKKLVESWYLHISALKDDKSETPDYDRINRELMQALKIPDSSGRRYSYPLWPLTAAAALLISMSAILYFSDRSDKTPTAQRTELTTQQSADDIPPGGNYATLTLADGRTIPLDQAENGQIAEEAGIKVSKTKDGQLLYEIIEGKNLEIRQASAIAYNKITTPKGGQYQVILPDGTRVWLNAASTLRYPTVFTEKDRKVMLTGEAYFEVKKEPKGLKIPFIVSTIKQDVKVLGTHFNINAYEDEGEVKTTLLEGSVLVTSTFDPDIEPVILKPNMQAVFGANGLKVTAADIETVTAWKNGFFQFNHTDMQSIMRQLARWYAIDVDYKTLPNLHFNGTISRNVNVSKVLNMLELTGNIKFKINGNKIYIL